MEQTYDNIRLGDNEWGNETMEAAAREYFEDRPAVQFVLVFEHGGWYLGYRRDGSIWTTANDGAFPLPHPTPTPSAGYSGVTHRRT